jgi:ankyrin repeat protein
MRCPFFFFFFPLSLPPFSISFLFALLFSLLFLFSPKSFLTTISQTCHHQEPLPALKEWLLHHNNYTETAFDISSPLHFPETCWGENTEMSALPYEILQLCWNLELSECGTAAQRASLIRLYLRKELIDAVDSGGRSALYLACSSPCSDSRYTKMNVQIVNLLLSCGANLMHRNLRKSMFPLHMAVCVHRYAPLVACILRHSCSSANLVSVRGRTALHYAVRATRRKEGEDVSEIVNLLLPHTNVNLIAADGHTPLIDAILFSDIKIIELLVHSGAELTFVNHRKETVMFHSVRRNVNEIFDFVFSETPNAFKAQMASLTTHHPLNCLFMAATNGNKHIVEKLLSVLPHEEIDMAFPIFHKPYKDITYMTSLWVAVFYKHTEVIRLLLEKSANPNLPETLHCRTPLHEAAWEGNLEITRLLIDFNAKCNAVERDGGTAISDAIYRGHITLVEYLLPLSTSVLNHFDKHECAPIHYAAARGYVECLSALLSCGSVDIQLRGKWGLNAMEMVKKLSDEALAVCKEPNLKSSLENECLSFFFAHRKKHWSDLLLRYRNVLNLLTQSSQQSVVLEGNEPPPLPTFPPPVIFTPPLPQCCPTIAGEQIDFASSSLECSNDLLEIESLSTSVDHPPQIDESAIACMKCRERRRWSHSVAVEVMKLFSGNRFPTVEEVENIVILQMID